MNKGTLDFINGVRSAAGMLAPTAKAAEPSQDPAAIASIQRSMQTLAIWLTESTFSDYDKADFSELPTDAQATICGCVSRLRELIAEFPPKDAPPKTIYERAAPIFRELFATLSAYFPSNR